MRWIYGKQDWKNVERGQENCYLMTNGLGGFSSMTMTGSVARNDHALLMACTKAPNHRYNLVHRIKEEISFEETGQNTYQISTQEFADKNAENGFSYLSAFIYEDTPIWRFHVKGVEIQKEAGMKQGANTVALRYEIRNQGKTRCTFYVTPFFQFVQKGAGMDRSQKLQMSKDSASEYRISSNGLTLHFRTNGVVEIIPETVETYFYSYDACDGRRESGIAKADHRIAVTVEPGNTSVLELIYEMEPDHENAEDIVEGVKKARSELAAQAGFTSEIARTLSKSAAQFISRRESTGGSTILAGFPFFEDWGRDTMIALPGVCIATGQYETARQILRTFAVNEKDGLMPNLFPEGGNEPMYNTADAALLFINCVYLYWEATEDEAFVREMYPVMERIIEGYRQGTCFGIHMDEDGLIQAGEGLAQVTWMDVRVGDILPTPRHGKPVEINAYWYNALCIMEKFVGFAKNEFNEYGRLAEKVKAQFAEKFWMEDKECLRDLISGTAEDEQIRCNQIWAVSMPFTMLEGGREKKIVEMVFEKLYTPYGLRTLAQEDEEFQPFYGGEMLKRDMAYHQGTVWTFPLGAYYLAYLKVHDDSQAARQRVSEQLEVLESALREGCIGQLPEIYDGKNPTSSKGCFAQAWSVGEILRVYEQLEKKD